MSSETAAGSFHTVSVRGGGRKIVFKAAHESRIGAGPALRALPARDCGGRGTCGKCRVVVTAGEAPPTAADLAHLDADALAAGVRLACQLVARGDLELTVEEKRPLSALRAFSGRVAYELEPAVSVRRVTAAKPSLADQRSDLTRFRAACPDLRVEHPDVLAGLTAALADSPTVNVVHDGRNVLRVDSTGRRLLGLAVDIGTTSVAAYLVDLETGRIVADAAEENAQRAFGADVITRIQQAGTDPRTAARLTELIVEQIGRMADALLADGRFDRLDLVDAVMAGNTTMLHFLLGQEAEAIARAPFIPVFTEMLSFPAAALGFCWPARVTVLPSISSYVGADLTAGLLVSGMAASEALTLYLDLGTNGEIALGDKDGILTCAAAAGPAFEGASLSCGMPALPGAVARVDLNDPLRYETIRGETARGLCGSGVLDLVAALLNAGLIDAGGRLLKLEATPPAAAVEETDSGRRFVLAGDVFLTDRDIREVQLAKAAVAAGIALLLEARGSRPEAIERVVVAGGFGYHMNPASAAAIRLLPPVLADRVENIGNGAGYGAVTALVSTAARRDLAAVAAMAQYVELSGREDFMDAFVDQLSFGAADDD